MMLSQKHDFWRKVAVFIPIFLLFGTIGYAQTDPVADLQMPSKGFWVGAGIGGFIAIYVWAIIRVRTEKMKVIVGWRDLLILLCVWLNITTVSTDAIFNDGQTLGTTLQLILICIAALLILVSVIITICNNRHLFNILYATIMKLVVIPIIPLTIINVLLHLSDDGPNRKRGIIKSALLLLVAVGGLVSFDE